jgi:hypothetical protein
VADNVRQRGNNQSPEVVFIKKALKNAVLKKII